VIPIWALPIRNLKVIQCGSVVGTYNSFRSYHVEMNRNMNSAAILYFDKLNGVLNYKRITDGKVRVVRLSS
jgi:hypothetical protein